MDTRRLRLILAASALLMTAFAVSETSASGRTMMGETKSIEQGWPSETTEEAYCYSVDDYRGTLTDTASAHSNFAGSTIDCAAHTLIVRGAGQVPSDVLSLIDQAPTGLAVSWQTVPNSAPTLTAAVWQAFDADSSIISAYFERDYDGIVVEAGGEDGKTQTSRAALGRFLERTIHPKIDVRVARGHAQEAANFSGVSRDQAATSHYRRAWDTSPF